jgi:hypothetical protein
MTAGRHINYEALAQDAMRGLVRTVLTDVAKSGLPGNHHFYISFNTQANGVVMSKRLKEKYPEEMMVVLQHRFWDLAVTEERFEVKLTFDSIPERLVVPFRAVKVFIDPSVPYGLQFEESKFDLGEVGVAEKPARRQSGTLRRPEAVPQDDASRQAPAEIALPDRPTALDRGDKRRDRTAGRRTRPEKQAGATSEGRAEPTSDRPAPPIPVQPRPQPVLAEVKPQPQPQKPDGAKVVRLDHFRKK